ncbi:predicted protein [Naegleria gruberi]|uniref:Predicted protein n=1 Tax=Naegleria gruberi TaxID=5762 RepID=D2VZT6_NAEGR|nr:uncharacterized protein NAEGRDRAFT_74613 [Naegleria gruberi]EFC37585.1 predicted protein [Naegleria gruberi]|eukprot:XP_002670329.1 predicted protein [Naegleria gruberi strain NEG-M]
MNNNTDTSLYTKQGRIIRAREDIDEGEILVIEKAYASVLHQSNINFNSHSFCVVCQKKKIMKNIANADLINSSSACCDKSTSNCNNEWMLCGDEGCEFLRNTVYKENELMDGQSMYDYLLRMAEECGIEFSLLLLVYRICRKFEFDFNSSNELASKYFDRNKMDNLLSLETHRDEIYPEHLFLFKKASSCLKERIFLDNVIGEELIIDTFCRIFVNAHSITHTRWWWHQSDNIIEVEKQNADTAEKEMEEISQFFKHESLKSKCLDSPFFIPACSSDREDHTENSCADFRDIGTGLFPMVSMFDHSCSPNCSFQTFDDMKSRNSYSGNVILVQTVKKVKKGEELCISYIDIMNPTCIRRRELWYSKYFVCRCSRCMSETEENRMVRAYSCGESECTEGYLVPIYHCNVSEEPKADLRHVNLNDSGVQPFDSENDFNLEDFDEEDYDKALSMFEDIYENDESREFNHDQREIDEAYIQRISYWKCTHCERSIEGEAPESELMQNMERHLNQELISVGQQVSEDNLKLNELPREEYCCVLLEIVDQLCQSIVHVESGSYPGFESLKVHPNHYLLFQMKGKFVTMLIKLFERGWWKYRKDVTSASQLWEMPLLRMLVVVMMQDITSTLD